MKYHTSAAFRTALEARLKAAKHDGVGVARLRKCVELRLDAQARTTKDIDVGWAISEDKAVGLLLDAAAVALDDRFEFAIERSCGDRRLQGCAKHALSRLPSILPLCPEPSAIGWSIVHLLKRVGDASDLVACLPYRTPTFLDVPLGSVRRCVVPSAPSSRPSQCSFCLRAQAPRSKHLAAACRQRRR